MEQIMDITDILLIFLKLIEHVLLDDIKKHKKEQYLTYKKGILGKLIDEHKKEIKSIDDQINMNKANIEVLKSAGVNTSKFDNTLKTLEADKAKHEEAINAVKKLSNEKD
jgi:hypothetical protein